MHFVARLVNESHILGGFCASRCPISGGEVLVAKPVAARGFMSGRGPEAVPCTGEWEGRSERSERRVLTSIPPAAAWATEPAIGGGQVVDIQQFTESFGITGFPKGFDK